MFGGKGKYVNFYRTGDELFDIMSQIERLRGTKSFFVMDENFLLNRARALQLLRRMGGAGKSWSLYVFSSVNAIRQYTMDELVQLGISWIWLGLESPHSSYAKLRSSDTQALVAELRQHGIRLLGSTIIGLEHHTPHNICQEIEDAVAYATDFHQFMLYTPVPGTPLFEQMQQEGRLLNEVQLADIHGQYKFNFQHAAISREDSKRLLDWAFRFDFERNGPSLFRICDTIFQAWRRYRDHPDLRVRQRIANESAKLRSTYDAALWAMEKRLRKSNSAVAGRIRTLRREIEEEFGTRTRCLRAIMGPILLWTSKREERRLARGKTYEPPTFVERRNWAT